MKVFIVLMIVFSGLGLMNVIDVMAKPAATLNGSAFTNKTMQANPLANSLSGQDTKKRPVRKAKIKKKYQVDKKKLLLILSILRKRK